MIANSTSFSDEPGATVASSSPLRMKSAACFPVFRPRFPAGCSNAKSSRVNCRAVITAAASASPITICAVVEAVGARPKGHASRSTDTLIVTSAWSASGLCSRPVKATIGTSIRFMAWMMAVTSSVQPLWDNTINTSPAATMPRSPCKPSAG